MCLQLLSEYNADPGLAERPLPEVQSDMWHRRHVGGPGGGGGGGGWWGSGWGWGLGGGAAGWGWVRVAFMQTFLGGGVG